MYDNESHLYIRDNTWDPRRIPSVGCESSLVKLFTNPLVMLLDDSKLRVILAIISTICTNPTKTIEILIPIFSSHLITRSRSFIDSINKCKIALEGEDIDSIKEEEAVKKPAKLVGFFLSELLGLGVTHKLSNEQNSIDIPSESPAANLLNSFESLFFL